MRNLEPEIRHRMAIYLEMKSHCIETACWPKEAKKPIQMFSNQSKCLAH